MAFDAWADEAHPGGCDLRLEVTVVPGESGVDARVTPAIGWRRLEEEVGVGEHGERRRPVRIAVDHVQRLLLDRVRERDSERHDLPLVRVRVLCHEVPNVTLEFAYGRIDSRRLAVDVHRASVAEVDV